VKTLLVALALLAPAAPKPVTEQAQQGQVRAELSYVFDEATENFDERFTRLHVRITRADVQLVDADLKPLCSTCSMWPAGGGDPSTPSLFVDDLDADGEPEVLVDLYTGGAHCCEYTLFYRYADAAYARLAHSWGNPGYRVRDFNRDRRPELVTGDDRFNYAFSCYACSAVPVRILHYQGGRLVNVTRSFRAQIRADAARTWRDYHRAVKQHLTPAGLLPAYLADQYLLGQRKAGWARVRAAVARRDWPKVVVEPQWKNRARYLAALKRFLVKTGYGG
jgi:hypothetical protein